MPEGGGTGGVGGFLLTLGAVFGYSAGWSPYAADYTRYLPADSLAAGPPGWPRASGCSCCHAPC